MTNKKNGAAKSLHPRARKKSPTPIETQHIIIELYETSGGNLRFACTEAGVTPKTHANWYTNDAAYREQFDAARKRVFPLMLQKAEQLSHTIIETALEMGVDKCPKHLLNAALSEIQFIRSTVGKEDYSSKVIQAVQVDDDGKMTWDDVMKTIQGEEQGNVETL